MNYTITNIEYGDGPQPAEVIYGGEIGNPAPGTTETNIHSITLLEGEDGRKVLIDTGVDTENPEKDALWKSLGQHIKGVVWGLAQVGLTPDDIDDVIITHAHIDHVGGIERFKNAHIYMNQEEFEAWEEMAADEKYLQLTLPAVYPPDFPPIRQMIEDGQITLLNGDVVNLLPGISIHVVKECHSVVEQLVLVDTKNGVYVLAGDVAARPTNLVGHDQWNGYLTPTLGRSGSARNQFKAYQWILDQVDGDIDRVVLTHDVTMRDRCDSADTEEGLQIHYIVK